MMKIYKEQSSDGYLLISMSTIDSIASDIEKLCAELHSYCTSDESYRRMCDNVDKEGR